MVLTITARVGYGWSGWDYLGTLRGEPPPSTCLVGFLRGMCVHPHARRRPSVVVVHARDAGAINMKTFCLPNFVCLLFVCACVHICSCSKPVAQMLRSKMACVSYAILARASFDSAEVPSRVFPCLPPVKTPYGNR